MTRDKERQQRDEGSEQGSSGNPANIGGPGGGEFTVSVDTGEISAVSPTAHRLMSYTATSVVQVELID